MQDTRLSEVFDVNAIEEEVSALVADGSRHPSAPPLRRPFSRLDRRLPEPRLENSAEMVEPTGPEDAGKAHDSINHPQHYTAHPSGVECIAITEWMNFNLGNAVKYIWRADDKGATIEDLKKARWYLDREIARLERLAS